MFLAFGLTFEVPVIVMVLVGTGMVSVEKLKNIRGYVIVGAFVVAAAVVPAPGRFVPVVPAAVVPAAVVPAPVARPHRLPTLRPERANRHQKDARPKPVRPGVADDVTRPDPGHIPVPARGPGRSTA